MPYSLDWNEHGVIAKFSGVVGLADITSCDEILNSDQRFVNAAYCIYSFLGSDLTAIVLGDTHEVGRTDVARSHNKSKLKLALVSNDDIGKNACRAYREYCIVMKIKWDIQIFENLPKAQAWCEES